MARIQNCSICKRPFSDTVKRSLMAHVCASKRLATRIRRPVCRGCVDVTKWLNSIALLKGGFMAGELTASSYLVLPEPSEVIEIEAENQSAPTDAEYMLPMGRRRNRRTGNDDVKEPGA